MRRTVIVATVLALVVAGCSSDDSDDGGADGTAAPTTTAAAEASEARAVVEELASDELEGRDNQTPGSEAAQELLVARLTDIAEPLPEAPDGYRWSVPGGTNVIGMIPGGELADEYVVVGAHYDHLGSDCRTTDPADHVCNGATDNAAGVATVLEIGRRLAADDQPPRRSVILALWDVEEDTLGGSFDFANDPPVPREDLVTYVNFDIQGANLLPSLADLTVMVGAETGGPNLLDAATAAADAGPLDTLGLSLLFGQGRSDHASFAGAGIPTVFFTDANTGCYHTAQDEVSIVDFDKLDEQIATGERLVRDLTATDDVPAFDPDTPAATFDDAAAILEVVGRGMADIDLLPAASRAVVEQYEADLTAIVESGPDLFNEEAVGILLAGAVDLVDALTQTTCDGYLD